jgi:O-antigen/teichoic acid export membrane protein
MRHSPTWEPILKSASVAIVNRFSSISLKILIIPLLINYLGTERFGIWVAISSASGYIFLLDMGLSSAMINRLTGFYAKGDTRSANQHIQGLFLFMAAIACIGILGTWLALPRIDWESLFKIHTAAARAEVNVTVLIAFCIFFLQLPLSLIQKIPYTFQAGYISELHILVANILGAVLIVAGLHFHAGLPFCVLAINAAAVFAPLTILIHLLITSHLNIGLKNGVNPIREVKSLKTASMHFIIMQICGTLLIVAPFSLITYYHGAEAVAVFGILLQVLTAVQTPLTVMLQPAWTKMVELSVNDKRHKIREIFTRYVKLATLYSILTGVFFMFFLPPIFALVLKHQVSASVSLRFVFAVWCALGLIGGGGVGAVTLALGLTGQISRISVLQLAAFLVLAFILIPAYGAVGAVACIIASYFVSLPLVFVLIRKNLYSAEEGVRI